MGYIILTALIAFITMFVPGELLALALLRKTKLSFFEISVIGFIFGLIAPASATWIESYFMNAVHAFTFSLPLFEANAIILAIVGLALCIQQGAFDGLFAVLGSKRKEVVAAERAEIASLEKEAKMTITQLREELSQYEAARSVISRHQAEEGDMRRRHEGEMSGINLNPNERAHISRLHSEEEERLMRDHEQEERLLLSKLKSGTTQATRHRGVWLGANWVWLVLLTIMLLTFATRMLSVSITPQFFEFDPYFDMLSAESILTFGYQVLFSPSAWPTIAAGTVMRIQPIVPYLEAYWYSLANSLGPHYATFSTSLMSYVGGIYAPITAALLVSVVFMLLYHEYGKYIGLIGASLAATMPVLFTTFVSGEQLLEPWGIFTLFFFFAAYMLAVKDMKSTRLAILAGVAFASTFLGAHYYTVDAGVLAIYILIQGIISAFRNDLNRDFFKMNIIVIIVISLFLIAYHPYHATLSGRIPNLLGMPITVGLPIAALIIVAIFEYVPKALKKYNMLFKKLNFTEYLIWFVFLLVVVAALTFATPVGNPIKAYLNLSTKFTTPSSALFMTVEEYIPTGPLYNFGSSGLGLLGSSIGGVPIVLWLVCLISIFFIFLSIGIRNSKTGILYVAIALPLMLAGFSEVKYLPHFGVALIMLFGIMLGEIYFMVKSDYYKGLKNRDRVLMVSAALGLVSLLISFSLSTTAALYAIAFIFIVLLLLLLYFSQALGKSMWKQDEVTADSMHMNFIMVLVFTAGLFMISSLFAFVYLFILLVTHKMDTQKRKLWGLIVLLLVIEIAAIFVNHSPIMGESTSILSAFSAAALHASSPTTACNTLASTSSIGYDLYCNVVPQYWLEATAWMRQNLGPYAPRVLSWWDYGDWINWFGNTNAVLRGDNANALEDYATAASFVLGTNDSFGPSVLANMMNTNQTKYVLFDNQLISKWQALDFLACVDVNQTSRAYAIAQGRLQSPPQPYVLGNSPCELSHDPAYTLVPLDALIGANTSSLNFYCSISNSTSTYIKSYEVQGNSLSNTSVCVSTIPTSTGAAQLYTSTGAKMNAMIPLSYYVGVIPIQGTDFVEYPTIYLPNGPNGTITDAPSKFYTSNYYRGFFLGELPGFTEVYPSNATGINYINGTYPIRIFELNNFTGTLPAVPSKPSWVHNNYTMP